MASTGDRGQPKFSAYLTLLWPPPSRSLVDWTRRVPHVKAGLALNPTFTISRARAAWAAMSDDPTYLAGLELVLEGLRKAGLPEE